MAHWEIYGGKNSVAVQMNSKKLFEQIENYFLPKELLSQSISRKIKEVDYIDHNEMDKKTEEDIKKDISNTLIKKHLSFEYEKEVRIIISGFKENQDLKKIYKDGFGIPIVNINALISRVIVSPDTDDKFFKLISDIAERYNIPKEKIERSSLCFTPDEFVSFPNRQTPHK